MVNALGLKQFVLELLNKRMIKKLLKSLSKSATEIPKSFYILRLHCLQNILWYELFFDRMSLMDIIGTIRYLELWHPEVTPSEKHTWYLLE